MRIKITTDSASDLSAALYQDYNISVIPLTIIKDGQPFQDGKDITIQDIYDHVDAGGELCSTSAVNAEDYREFFTAFSGEYDAVIHVSLGYGFSSCCQNACTAAADFPNVYVTDSQNLSSGEGLVVMAAAEMAQAGKLSAQEILAALEDLIPRVETSFLLDRLDYMVKGGRCSAVAALGATLLHLHPCIEVKDGAMRVGRKYRGSLAKCLTAYAKDRLEGRTDLEMHRCFVTHSGVTPEISTLVQETVKECQPFELVQETWAGGTVACHCGNNCLGVLFVRKPEA